MTTDRFSPHALALAALALMLVASLAWRAGANAAPKPAAAPTAVCVLNVERVLNGLNELTEFNARLQARVDELQKSLDRLKVQIEGKAAELEELQKTAVSQRRAVRAELFELEAQAKARQEVLQTLLNIEKGEAIRAMYLKMVEATRDVAAKAGYDLVLFDDQGMNIPDGMPDRNVNAAIQARQVIYASSAIDISDQVLTYMNNLHSAGARN